MRVKNKRRKTEWIKNVKDVVSHNTFSSHSYHLFILCLYVLCVEIVLNEKLSFQYCNHRVSNRIHEFVC